MTRQRKNHIVAISLLVAALVAGGVCWTLEGTAFWVVSGVAIILIVVGIYAAGRASSPRAKDESPTG